MQQEGMRIQTFDEKRSLVKKSPKHTLKIQENAFLTPQNWGIPLESEHFHA